MSALILSLVLAMPTLVINHLGRVLDQDDHPVAGPVDLKFELHTNPIRNAGDEVVWTDEFASTPVDLTGSYAVVLGDTSAAAGPGHHALTPDLFTDNRWLAISVNGVALQPWLQVGAVPFAVHASGADTVGGLAASNVATPGELLALDAQGRFPTSVLPTASATQDGVLAHADYAAFAGKIDHVTTGSGLLGDGTATNPLSVAQLGVMANAPLTGDGTTAKPLGIALATGPGLSGNGTAASPLAMSISTGAGLTGNGTTSPLSMSLSTGAGLTGNGTTSPLAVSLATGAGLAGNGTTSALSVQFAGSGSADSAARSDHTHSEFGQFVQKGSALAAPTMTLAPSSAPACNAQAAGSMYFDATSKHFYGCDGTSWTAFVSAPTPGGPNVVRLGDVLLEWGIIAVDTSGQTNFDVPNVTFPVPFTQTPSVQFHVADTGPWGSEPTITSCGVTTNAACLQLASHTQGTPYATAMNRSATPVYWIAIGR